MISEMFVCLLLCAKVKFSMLSFISIYDILYVPDYELKIEHRMAVSLLAVSGATRRVLLHSNIERVGAKRISRENIVVSFIILLVNYYLSFDFKRFNFSVALSSIWFEPNFDIK